MLANSQAVAFAPALDLDRSREFYEGVLGLTVTLQDEFTVRAQAGGVGIWITRVASFTAQPFTVVGFNVDDIDAVIDGVSARGVVFEHYGFLGEAQDSSGVWTAPSGARVAWFKDPDGNLLSVQQMP